MIEMCKLLCNKKKKRKKKYLDLLVLCKCVCRNCAKAVLTNFNNTHFFVHQQATFLQHRNNISIIKANYKKIFK